MAVLRAAHKHKVKRVVLTSSGLTVAMRKPENQKALYNESDWSDLEILAPYEKSKTLAEQAAWKFVEELPEGEKIELVTIIAGLVQGPALIQSEFSSSNYMKMLMLGLMPALPKVMFPIVDVRNVAEAHLNAIKKAEAKNKRFILCERTYKFLELSQTLQRHFGDAYKFTLTEMAECPHDNARFKINWDKEYNLDRTSSE